MYVRQATPRARGSEGRKHGAGLTRLCDVTLEGGLYLQDTSDYCCESNHPMYIVSVCGYAFVLSLAEEPLVGLFYTETDIIGSMFRAQRPPVDPGEGRWYKGVAVLVVEACVLCMWRAVSRPLGLR